LIGMRSSSAAAGLASVHTPLQSMTMTLSASAATISRWCASDAATASRAAASSVMSSMAYNIAGRSPTVVRSVVHITTRMLPSGRTMRYSTDWATSSPRATAASRRSIWGTSSAKTCARLASRACSAARSATPKTSSAAGLA
jgi:hypothetical protein